MKHLTRTSIPIIIMLLMIVLSACGPAQTPAPPKETAPAVSGVKDICAGGEKIDLVLWEQSAEWRIKAQQATIDDFQKLHPCVTIKIESFPFVEYQTKINTTMKAGTAADIITTVGQWAPPLIQAGYVAQVPEDVLSPDTLLSDYWEGPAKEAIMDGKVYMVPNHVTMGTGGLIYNADLLKEAGVPDNPTFKTWEEFMQAAQKCTKFDADGKMTQSGFGTHGVIDSFTGMAFVLQEGNEIIVDGKIAFDNEKGLAALQAYQDMFLKYKVDSPEFVGGLDGFPQGRVCMMNIGAWAGKAAELQNPSMKVVYGNALPSINPDYPPYVQSDTQWQFIINAKSKNMDAIWEFIKFYLTKEQFMKRVPIDGEVPSLKAAALEFEKDPTLDAYVWSAQYSKWSGYKVDREKFNNTVNTYLEQLARGQLTPEQALRGLVDDLNKVLAGQ